MINVAKLSQELKTAGIAISGCNSSGVVWDLNNNEIQAQPSVAAIIAAHDPIDYEAQDTAALIISSEVAMKAIPNWARWTQVDWTTYYNANISATQVNAITNIATAIVVLNKMSTIMDGMAKMIIAIRDRHGKVY